MCNDFVCQSKQAAAKQGTCVFLVMASTLYYDPDSSTSHSDINIMVTCTNKGNVYVHIWSNNYDVCMITFTHHFLLGVLLACLKVDIHRHHYYCLFGVSLAYLKAELHVHHC